MPGPGADGQVSISEALRSSIRDVAGLRAYLSERGIAPESVGISHLTDPAVLPVRVPRYYLDLVDWSDPDDPLRRQVLPLVDEEEVLPDDLRDPIGDDSHSPVPGIVHR